MSSPQPEVRQAAAYGCGVLGQFGGPGLAAAAAQAVPLLCEVIQAPDSRAVENINPTENAISAVTKILQFNGSAVNLDQVFAFSMKRLKASKRKNSDCNSLNLSCTSCYHP